MNESIIFQGGILDIIIKKMTRFLINNNKILFFLFRM